MTALAQKIETHLSTDFEKALLNASVAYLQNETDPLRFNSFAYSMRELYRHVLTRLAPDEKIKECAWFKQEADTGKPTRKQKYTYAIQGGLLEDYVKNNLDMDLIEFWNEIRDSQDLMSKYTHVNENTFNISNKECIQHSLEIKNSLLEILSLIEDTRAQLMSKLKSKIDKALLAHLLTTTVSDLDILSNQTIVENVVVEDYEVIEIGPHHIHLSGEGFVSVSLNYGQKEDATEISDSFPLMFKCHSTTAKPEKIHIQAEHITIDTDDWYQ